MTCSIHQDKLPASGHDPPAANASVPVNYDFHLHEKIDPFLTKGINKPGSVFEQLLHKRHRYFRCLGQPNGLHDQGGLLLV